MKLKKSPEIVNKFLNRLSDFLFVLSRKIGLELDNEELNGLFNMLKIFKKGIVF